MLGKRPGGASVASAGNEESMRDRNASSKLEVLLQRAAAYSAFLRERLQQSRSILNSTDMSQSRSILNSTDMSTRNMSVDPRQPKLVTGAVLRGYQVDGVQWLVSLYENGLNGILADEMGLGKTLQVISFFAHLLEMKVKGPFLVVAPLSTVGNWVKEFQRFAPGTQSACFTGIKYKY
jgi:SNF2 family DNA or RNA helicase